MFNITEKSIQVGDKTLNFQTGKIAKQASGAALVQCGGTVVLVTAQAANDPKPGIDFVPLTVDYMEKMSAAGRIPGGFFKREGRPRDEETLISRLIDRSIRPLLPEAWNCETQVIATVFSSDPESPADALALCGASLALGLSDVPFAGPIAGLRVCRLDGQLVLNPSNDTFERAELNIFVSVSEDAIVMVEGGGKEASEKDVTDALFFVHEEAQKIIKLQKEMVAAAGKTKRTVTPKPVDEELKSHVRRVAVPKLEEAYGHKEKLPRYAALDRAKKKIQVELLAVQSTYAERGSEISALLGDLKYTMVRENILASKKRLDGRGLTDIRPITIETGILPRAHGSVLFTRGETQALVTATLGSRQDEQKIDDLFGERYRRFMLHYNFPPYSVGETKGVRSPGRREIGHGALAERAVQNVVQFTDDFMYTVRVVSDITESNGSSSMATVCGGSLALMDAGVPIKAPCAGIAMGLIKEGDQIAILSDILGDEDHLGDMDFKVAGTRQGITAIQMDIKIAGVTRAILEQALEQARQGRLHILDNMDKVISKSREQVSVFAPRITTMRIKIDRIRDVIGPGGRVIKDIVARTGCQVDIKDDGVLTIVSPDSEAAQKALKMVQDLTQEAEVGKLYLGNVRKITDFGAFVEIFPGTDGLVHISELSDRRVRRVEDVLQEGDEVLVKVIGVENGKVKLSRKEALAEEQRLVGA